MQIERLDCFFLWQMQHIHHNEHFVSKQCLYRAYISIALNLQFPASQVICFEMKIRKQAQFHFK